ncbi:MAG: preprotein translocase subunit SecG [Elusimicrobia bacterium]|nr:preprotein translocase subunit SecG [Elusimicrobiota bacterium]MDE2236589.1 preprotein translocase subunit SecG [Elusimicrobiota bacterium]MDE2426049.1 preprotein translocase subunit SecG [Elusimicrobiota bacterium]
MLYNFLLTVHVAACLLLILVILLQTGRGAGLSVFGGGGDSLITTPTGSNFMKNLTSVLAGTFAFTALFLTLLQSRSGLTSVTSRAMPPPLSAPAAARPAPSGQPARPGRPGK